MTTGEAKFVESVTAIAHDEPFFNTLDGETQDLAYKLGRGEITYDDLTFKGVILLFDAVNRYPAIEKVWPQASLRAATDESGLVPKTAWADENVFEVNYPDGIQVLIDRTVAGEIDVRVWKIGDDNELDTKTFYLPELTDCFNCGNRHAPDGLDDNRYCSECTRAYTPAEIEAMKNFASGYIEAAATNEGDTDQWVTFSSALDIHFRTNDDDTSPDFKKVQAWGYRRPERPEVGDQDCKDELRLF